LHADHPLSAGMHRSFAALRMTRARRFVL